MNDEILLHIHLYKISIYGHTKENCYTLIDLFKFIEIKVQHYTQNMIFNVGKHLTVYMEFESIGLKFKKSIESFFIQKLCPFGVLPNEFSLNFERVAVSLKKCKKKEKPSGKQTQNYLDKVIV